MNKLTISLLFLGMSSTAMGELSTRVCLADGNTPLELADPNVPFIYRDIMVGTKLTIIVSSDAEGEWSSDLAIEEQFWGYGLLSGRDYNDITADWEGSRLEAASDLARVLDWIELGIKGFNLEANSFAIPGDWFIIDYTATETGVCKVAFYDRSISWNYPAYYFVFSHVATRDFNNDSRVGFVDFALLGSHWLDTGCGHPDWCEGADLDADGNVDCDDLMLFTDYWLEKTE
jgi:hypothetical protein